jgi:two-component system, NarL family, response regulator LiaR
VPSDEGPNRPDLSLDRPVILSRGAMDDNVTTVVIAEDHALVREGTRRILEQDAGIHVVGEARDGGEAVALAGTLHPHVAIIDIGMPTVNGLEATRQIKARWPEISVLILTVHDDDQYVFALLEAGAAGYLLKDTPGDKLIEAVKGIRAGESVLDPAITEKVLSRFRSASWKVHPPAQTPLSARELDVLRTAAKGSSNKEIAESLGLSSRTVQVHLSHIFDKLEVASRTEAVITGLQRGWFTIDEVRPT